jgi:hypothetical protein
MNPISPDELIAQWERQYVEFLNALLASTGNDADYWRWSGHAARLRECLTDFHRWINREVPPYGTKKWRTSHGVSKP